MSNDGYVHGYTDVESSRLIDQANTLAEILHHDSLFPKGSRVLEAGCGVGAQTRIICQKNPDIDLVSIDISPSSVDKAQSMAEEMHLTNVSFEVADIFHLPFEEGSFDHVFICFVLEHMPDPVAALASLAKVLRKGGTLTVIEGDHGSVYFHPESEEARRAIACLVELQRRSGGDGMIGRRLYPLLSSAGLEGITVSPRMVYVDESRPRLVDGFTLRTFTAMVEGVRDSILSADLMSEADLDKGIKDLKRTAGRGGTFCYTFFKAVAAKA